jgi:hypothetical protein
VAFLLPRTIRARFLLVSVLAIVAAFAVVGLAVPAIARDHEIDVLGARLGSDANIAGDLARDLFRSGDAEAAFAGDDEQRFATFAEVRDAIRERVEAELLVRV